MFICSRPPRALLRGWFPIANSLSSPHAIWRDCREHSNHVKIRKVSHGMRHKGAEHITSDPKIKSSATLLWRICSGNSRYGLAQLPPALEQTRHSADHQINLCFQVCKRIPCAHHCRLNHVTIRAAPTLTLMRFNINPFFMWMRLCSSSLHSIREICYRIVPPSNQGAVQSLTRDWVLYPCCNCAVGSPATLFLFSEECQRSPTGMLEILLARSPSPIAGAVRALAPWLGSYLCTGWE